MKDAVIFEQMSRPERRAKFLGRLSVTEAGCHEWTMARNPRGYGVFRIGFEGQSYTCMVHRVAWMLANGKPLSADAEVDHLCRNPSCANPAHLEAVGHGENVARSYGWRNAERGEVVRRGPRTVHRRRRARGDKFLVTWRDYLADGTNIQRGRQFNTRAEADAFSKSPVDL